MPLITAKTPDTWDGLEELVKTILNECGMMAERNVSLPLPRGSIDVDVLAQEIVDGITHRTICECKNWRHKIPREIVHAFRTVMQETGAHRGYIISKVGFQSGAMEAAKATNIELVTFTAFQEIYFDKWIAKQIWSIEDAVGNFNTYYEPLGPPGYSSLKIQAERDAYDAVFEQYAFAGLMLQPFSPYMRLVRPYPFPPLPFDVSELEERGLVVPGDIKAATGYREFFELLTSYAKAGLAALRAVNPVTWDQPPGSGQRDG